MILIVVMLAFPQGIQGALRKLLTDRQHRWLDEQGASARGSDQKEGISEQT